MADSLPAKPEEKPKNTGVDSLSLLQGIFPTQESNQGLLQILGQILYQLRYQGSSLSHWTNREGFRFIFKKTTRSHLLSAFQESCFMRIIIQNLCLAMKFPHPTRVPWPWGSKHMDLPALARSVPSTWYTISILPAHKDPISNHYYQLPLFQKVSETCRHGVLVPLCCIHGPGTKLTLWSFQFRSAQFSRSVVSDSVTPWIAARQASLLC